MVMAESFRLGIDDSDHDSVTTKESPSPDGEGQGVGYLAIAADPTKSGWIWTVTVASP